MTDPEHNSFIRFVELVSSKILSKFSIDRSVSSGLCGKFKSYSGLGILREQTNLPSVKQF